MLFPNPNNIDFVIGNGLNAYLKCIPTLCIIGPEHYCVILLSRHDDQSKIKQYIKQEPIIK